MQTYAELVEQKRQEVAAFIASLERIADLSCHKCGWTRFAQKRPDESVADALTKGVRDLQGHIERGDCVLLLKRQS